MSALHFTTAPHLVTDHSNASGPWWGRIVSVSDTHALGDAVSRVISTSDGGSTWSTQQAWKDDTGDFGGLRSLAGDSFHFPGPDRTFLSPTGRNENITGVTANYTIRFSANPSGFVRAVSKPFSIGGLPHLSGFHVGGGSASLWLRDGRTMLATAVTTGVGKRWGYLSLIAMHSTDGGYAWSYSDVVASADEVPFAHEGPSENALAFLRNGSILCVFRIEGESGHHSPYHSKVSDDGGRSWKHLRALSVWPGETIAPGCVRPRLLPLGGSLVLAGGRPSPISHDVMVWLNAKGDGDVWRPYSISYWHNRLIGPVNTSWTIPAGPINDSRRLPRYTTSYTSLLRTSNDSACLVYGAGLNAFSMPMQLVD